LPALAFAAVASELVPPPEPDAAEMPMEYGLEAPEEPAVDLAKRQQEIFRQRQQEILRQVQWLNPDNLTADPDMAAHAADGVPWLLSVWDSDSGLEGLFEEPTEDGNAAAHFRKLEDLYAKERNSDRGRMTVPPSASGVDELLAAARLKECRLAPDFYPWLDEGTNRQPNLVVYFAYLQALLTRADEHWRDGDNPAAEEAYRAGLACGRHLATDSPTLIVYTIGLRYKIRAAREYSRFLRRELRSEEAARAEAYAERMDGIYNLISRKSQTILGEFERFASLPAMAVVACEDSQPFWRAEAVMRLGVFRHGAPERGSEDILFRDPAMERLAEEALSRVAREDDEPWLRRLAAWTIANITPEWFDDFRQSFDVPGQ